MRRFWEFFYSNLMQIMTVAGLLLFFVVISTFSSNSYGFRRLYPGGKQLSVPGWRRAAPAKPAGVLGLYAGAPIHFPAGDRRDHRFADPGPAGQRTSDRPAVLSMLCRHPSGEKMGRPGARDLVLNRGNLISLMQNPQN